MINEPNKDSVPWFFIILQWKFYKYPYSSGKYGNLKLCFLNYIHQWVHCVQWANSLIFCELSHKTGFVPLTTTEYTSYMETLGMAGLRQYYPVILQFYTDFT